MKRELVLGVVLASVCLLAALIQLGWFMYQVGGTMDTMSKLIADLIKDPSQNAATLRYAVAARIALMHQSLVASGVMVGVAFGFVGFALFVMGITGTAEIEGKTPSYSLALKNAAPGLVLLVVAAGLIAVCVIQRVAVDYTPSPQPSGVSPEAPRGAQNQPRG
jgi:hypothetical protein